MTITSLRILAASWNVNGKPCKEDLTPWLKVPDEYHLQPDVYAIGLQEEDLRPEAYLQIDEERLNGWRAGIENVLLAEGDYVEVACCQLVGLVILVYCTRQLAPHISDVDTAMVGCGYAGVMGNKGAVGVRFMLGGQGPNEVARTVCIINSHLNAHTHNVKRRQADYESICNRMVFFSDKPLSAVTPPHNLEALKSLIAHDTEDAAPALADDANGTEGANNDKVEQAQAQAAQAEKLDGLRPLEHDLVIWLGDLNYRIELSRDDIISAALAHDWERLHRADQLRREIAASNVFQGFNELPPRFMPTYKFDSGTDRYDTSAKQRVPAHCDRIIWRVHVDPSHHRHHRPSMQVTPPATPLDAAAGSPGRPAASNGAPTTPRAAAAPGGGVGNGRPAPLTRTPSTVLVVPGTGTANLINPALATSLSMGDVLRSGRDSGDAETWQRRSRSMPAFGPRGPVWRPADITTVYYKCHMELRASDHKPISALLLVNLGFPLSDRELDESTLAMPQGSKLARRILPDTVLKRRGYLTRLTLNWLSTYATNYRMWLALGGVGLLLYYFL